MSSEEKEEERRRQVQKDQLLAEALNSTGRKTRTAARQDKEAKAQMKERASSEILDKQPTAENGRAEKQKESDKPKADQTKTETKKGKQRLQNPLVFDIGRSSKTTKEEIMNKVKTEISADIEMDQMEKGGVVIRFETNQQRREAKGKLSKWSRQIGISIHLPKGVQEQSESIFIHNLPSDWKEEDILEGFEELGVEVRDLYMWPQTGKPNKARLLVEPTRQIATFLEEGRGTLNHARIYVQKGRNPEQRVCYNCLKIGHAASKCQEKRKCRKCGKSDGHIASECTETEKVCIDCGDKGHMRADCEKRKADLAEYNRKQRQSQYPKLVTKQSWADVASRTPQIDEEQLLTKLTKMMIPIMTKMMTPIIERTIKQTMDQEIV